MCMQKSFTEDKTCTESFVKEILNAKEGRGKRENMQKKAFMRKMIQGKCLNRGKMFATKAFHEGKVSMKKTFIKGKDV